MGSNAIEQKFNSFYESKLSNNIKVSEKLRLKYKTIQTACLAIAAIMLAIVIAIYTALGTKTTAIVLMSIFGIVGGGAFFASTKIPEMFRDKLKRTLLKSILQVFGRFDWRKDELISLADVKNLGLYNEAESKKDDDVIIGVYDNIPLIFTETEISHITQNKKEIDFNGLIISAKLNRPFNCSIIAYHTATIHDYKNIVEKFYKKDTSLCSKEAIEIAKSPNYAKKTTLSERKRITYVRKMKKVISDELGFKPPYDIFSDKSEEARKLISEKLIEKIQILQTIFNTPRIDFAFKNSNVYLFLHKDFNKNDYFEIGKLQESLPGKERFLAVFKELIQVVTVVSLIKQMQPTEE